MTNMTESTAHVIKGNAHQWQAMAAAKQRHRPQASLKQSSWWLASKLA